MLYQIPVLLLIVMSLASLPVHAYRSNELIKIVAPTDTPATYLTGYNSKTGRLVEKCVNEPGHPSFSYTRSMELIERAGNVARINRKKVSGGAAEARAQRLGREYRLAVNVLRANKVCLDKELSNACKNLLARFANFASE